MTEQEKREKVINGLETVVDQMECEVAEWVNYTDSELNDGLTVDCDWWSGALGKLEDALELLKAHESVEPNLLVMNGRLSNGTKYICGGCGGSFFHQKVNFCPWCGRAVKWE